MPQAIWSAKRERQYQHIKEGAEASGKSEKVAERIAAATVNKDRARAGAAKTASRTSLEGPSPERRGGLHSHSGAAGRPRSAVPRGRQARHQGPLEDVEAGAADGRRDVAFSEGRSA